MSDMMDSWRKACKLKSRIDNLKLGPWYRQTMQKFFDYKLLTHKNVGPHTQRKKLAEVKTIFERKLKAYEVQKAQDDEANKEQKAKEAEERKLAGLEVEEDDVDKDDPNRPVMEEPEFPAIMDSWEEEDWMLAQFRAETHCTKNYIINI